MSDTNYYSIQMRKSSGWIIGPSNFHSVTVPSTK
jgi:hypothetical protein